MKVSSLNMFYATILLVVMSVTLSFATQEATARSNITVAVMYVVPLLLVFNFPYFRRDEWPIYLLILSMFLTSFMNSGSLRWSSLMYSMMYIVTFFFYVRLIYAGALDLRRYMSVIKFIIKAYFVVLILQQLCVLLGLPVINAITSTGLDFKLNALSPEPSHSARILTFLMFSYVKSREIMLGRKYKLGKDFRRDKWIWFVYLYSMITMMSGLAFVLLFVFAMYFVRPRNVLIYVPLFIGLLYAAYTMLDISALNRAVAFTESLFTFDMEHILATDHSAAIRVAPVFVYFSSLDILSWEAWFGHGMDYNAYLFPRLVYGVLEGAGIGGMFPVMLLNNGIVTFSLMITMLRKMCLKTFFSFDMVLWIIAIATCGFNLQITWLAFMLMMTNKYFAAQNKPAKIASIQHDVASI